MTITYGLYNVNGHLLSTWVGTDDTPTSDLSGDGVIDWRDFRYAVMVNGIAQAVRFRDISMDGDLDDTLYFTSDATFNVTAVIDAGSGDVAERYSFTPYGQRTIMAEDFTGRSSSAFDVTEGHQGKRHDQESGLVYNNARYLHTSLGVFTIRDLIGYADGMNVYLPVGANPVNRVDPTGTTYISVRGVIANGKLRLHLAVPGWGGVIDLDTSVKDLSGDFNVSLRGDGCNGTLFATMSLPKYTRTKVLGISMEVDQFEMQWETREKKGQSQCIRRSKIWATAGGLFGLPSYRDTQTLEGPCSDYGPHILLAGVVENILGRSKYVGLLADVMSALQTWANSPSKSAGESWKKAVLGIGGTFLALDFLFPQGIPTRYKVYNVLHDIYRLSAISKPFDQWLKEDTGATDAMIRQMKTQPANQ